MWTRRKIWKEILAWEISRRGQGWHGKCMWYKYMCMCCCCAWQRPEEDSSVPVDHLTHCPLEMGSLGEPGGRLADRSPTGHSITTLHRTGVRGVWSRRCFAWTLWSEFRSSWSASLLLATEPSLLSPYFNQCRVCKLTVTMYPWIRGSPPALKMDENTFS